VWTTAAEAVASLDWEDAVGGRDDFSERRMSRATAQVRELHWHIIVHINALQRYTFSVKPYFQLTAIKTAFIVFHKAQQ